MANKELLLEVSALPFSYCSLVLALLVQHAIHSSFVGVFKLLVHFTMVSSAKAR